MSKAETVTSSESAKAQEDCKETKVMKAAKKAVLTKEKPEQINLSRRYFTLGLFASVVLFKKKIINPSYQISKTGKFTMKVTILFYKLMKFLVWSATKK